MRVQFIIYYKIEKYLVVFHQAEVRFIDHIKISFNSVILHWYGNKRRKVILK